MGHRLRLFTGPLKALRPFLAASVRARVFSLSPASPFPVLPLGDDLHDALHAVYGTGDWLETGAMLTSSDLAFAAQASRGAALAYVETNYFGGQGSQSAALWRDGVLILKPLEMTSEISRSRPRSLWPINIALKTLGVVARPGIDEFEALGLGAWRQTDDIFDRASEIKVPL